MRTKTLGHNNREDGGDGRDLSFPDRIIKKIKWAMVGYTRTSVVELGWPQGGVKGQRYEISWLESFVLIGQRDPGRPNPCQFIVLAHCASPNVPERVKIDTHADTGANVSVGKSSSTMQKKKGSPIHH